MVKPRPLTVLVLSLLVAAACLAAGISACKEVLIIPAAFTIILLTVSTAAGRGRTLLRPWMMYATDLTLLLNAAGLLLDVAPYSDSLWEICFLAAPSFVMIALLTVFVLIGYARVRLDWVMTYVYTIFLAAAYQSCAITLFNLLEADGIPADLSMAANYWVGAEFAASYVMTFLMLVAAYCFVIRRYQVRLITAPAVTVSR